MGALSSSCYCLAISKRSFRPPPTCPASAPAPIPARAPSKPASHTPQVELARLKYEAAHLVQSGGANKGRDSGYDRQRGGLGAVGGSGEKALETQRRLLRDRTAEVNRQLKDVERRRGFQRGARNRRLEPTVALVGYTNVGKSSLLNQLTLSHHRAGGVGGQGVEAAGGGGGGGFSAGGSGWGGGRGKGMVHARNRVFDTLDPTVRSMTLPSRAR